MALTEEQTFKIGFLLKCAEEGLTMEETHSRIKTILTSHKQLQKQAFLSDIWKATKDVGSSGLDLAKAIAGPVVNYSSIAALGLPIAGGAALGYGAAKLTNPDKDFIADAKQDELVGEYERLAEDARRRARIKQLQSQLGRKIVALTPETT